MHMGGSALYAAMEVALDKARLVAAQMLQADENAIEFTGGAFHVKDTGQSVGLLDVAAAAKDPKMSGGEALVNSLVREGVEVIFGLPGVQMYGVVSAIKENPAIKMIVPRHEQATTYMADGYARASRGIGVAMVVPGPGLYNAAAGLSRIGA